MLPVAEGFGNGPCPYPQSCPPRRLRLWRAAPPSPAPVPAPGQAPGPLPSTAPPRSRPPPLPPADRTAPVALSLPRPAPPAPFPEDVGAEGGGPGAPAAGGRPAERRAVAHPAATNGGDEAPRDVVLVVEDKDPK